MKKGFISIAMVFMSQATAFAGTENVGSVPSKIQSSGAKSENSDLVVVARSRGMQLIEAGRPADAVPYYSRAIAVSPLNIDLYLERSRAYYEFREFGKSLADAKTAIGISPTNVFGFYRAGCAASALQDYKQALTYFDRGIELDPKKGIFFVERAQLYAQTGHFEKSISDASHAIKLDPSYPFGYEKRAFALEKLKRFEEALADCDRAISLSPKPYFFSMRANLLALMGKPREALMAFTEALKLSRSESGAIYQITDSLRARDASFDVLASFYDEAIQADPRRCDLYTGRANVYIQSGKFQAAIKDADSAIVLNRSDPMGFYRKACALKGLGELRQALVPLNEAISLGQEFYFYFLRAEINFKLHRYQNAIADNDAALKLNPHNVDIIRFGASIRAISGDYEQAVNSFDALHRKNNNGAVKAPSQQQISNAILGYSSILKLNPNDSETFYNRGILYLCLGKPVLAAADLREFVKGCRFPTAKTLGACCCNIAYRQAGNGKAADSILSQSSESSKGWPYSLVDYLRRQLNPDDVIATCASHDDQARAKCYIGLDLILRSESEKAKPYLEWVTNHCDPKLDEFMLAQVALAKLHR